MDCKQCGKPIGADNWESAKVIKSEPGSYFQGPKRTWRLEAPGVEAFMIDDRLLCPKCYAELAEA